jgi:hypothetical protein
MDAGGHWHVKPVENATARFVSPLDMTNLTSACIDRGGPFAISAERETSIRCV